MSFLDALLKITMDVIKDPALRMLYHRSNTVRPPLLDTTSPAAHSALDSATMAGQKLTSEVEEEEEEEEWDKMTAGLDVK